MKMNYELAIQLKEFGYQLNENPPRKERFTNKPKVVLDSNGQPTVRLETFRFNKVDKDGNFVKEIHVSLYYNVRSCQFNARTASRKIYTIETDDGDKNIELFDYQVYSAIDMENSKGYRIRSNDTYIASREEYDELPPAKVPALSTHERILFLEIMQDFMKCCDYRITSDRIISQNDTYPNGKVAYKLKHHLHDDEKKDACKQIKLFTSGKRLVSAVLEDEVVENSQESQTSNSEQANKEANKKAPSTDQNLL